MLDDYDRLLERISGGSPPPAVVVQPYVSDAFDAVSKAFDSGAPQIYVTGDAAILEPLLRNSALDPNRVEIVHAPATADAVTEAARLVAEGAASFVVKGSVTSADLLKGLLGRARLGTGSVASHLYVIEAPAYGGRTVAFSDAGVNIEPDLQTKTHIVRNSVSAMHALGVDAPRIAVLSAMEYVKPTVPSSMDAALLAQMSRRGQLGDVILDGPLSIDAALSISAAAAKSLTGPVAGHADLLLAPNIDAANMTSKALIGTHGRAMAVVLGAKAPIALPSRGDSLETRTHSLLLAAYLAQRMRS
ncbi:phosphate acyltransferase [Rhodococcus ruber]|uniref:phosphate acyltransferase n=1 Tax=Rhodococcus ruber TaxID=1830 RepID=UPI000E6B4871|nr:phosphate acyltransferase [Rhodococcus ruber]AXY49276.1 phosphate acetyltransferase [Rhodococcus ruber]